MISFSDTAHVPISSAGVQNRTFPPEDAARSLDAAFEVRIVKMFAIPSEHEIHSMDGRQRKVNGIRSGVYGYNLAFEQVAGEGLGIFGLIQQRNSGQHGLPCGGHLRVANRNFVQNDGRSEYLVFTSALVPPLSRRLLIGGNPNERTRSRREIARDGRLDVKFRQAHRCILPECPAEAE
jgi:hypothetical protein